MSAAFPPSTAPSRRTALRGIGAGAFALAGAGALGACSSREAAAGKADAADTSGFTITDQRGKKVAFDGPVERIATAIIPSPLMIAAVDGSYDRIVGINESTLKVNKEGIQGRHLRHALPPVEEDRHHRRRRLRPEHGDHALAQARRGDPVGRHGRRGHRPAGERRFQGRRRHLRNPATAGDLARRLRHGVAERGGTVVVLGENGDCDWIPGLRGLRPTETNFWWWRTPGGDNGVRRAAHGHEAWDHLTGRAVRRHYHGLLEPPAGATVLACAELEEEGDPATRQVLLHEDRVSTPGRLIVTTMDPVYHHGSRFMPGATQLLLGLLRRTGTTAPARPE